MMTKQEQIDRRVFLGSIVGAAASAVVGTLATVQGVRAANGDPVLVGESHDETSATGFTNTVMDSGVGIGLEAEASFVGVHGVSNWDGLSVGVLGESTQGQGVVGKGPGGGVSGSGTYGDGVDGTSNHGRGVSGFSQRGDGVSGYSDHGNGVAGYGQELPGVLGNSGRIESPGIMGLQTAEGTGVFGASFTPAVTFPNMPVHTGVFGFASLGRNSVGVRGESTTGRGAVFKGNLAQLRLWPSLALTHPDTGQAGDLFVDSSKRLWFCQGGTTWKQLA